MFSFTFLVYLICEGILKSDRHAYFEGVECETRATN